MTAFEELCREWVLQQAIQGALPFMPDRVGSHWSKDAQVDVVAIRWNEKQILLGEAKWGVNAMGLPVRAQVYQQAGDNAPIKGLPPCLFAETSHYAARAYTCASTAYGNTHSSGIPSCGRN